MSTWSLGCQCVVVCIRLPEILLPGNKKGVKRGLIFQAGIITAHLTHPMNPYTTIFMNCCPFPCFLSVSNLPGCTLPLVSVPPLTHTLVWVFHVEFHPSQGTVMAVTKAINSCFIIVPASRLMRHARLVKLNWPQQHNSPHVLQAEYARSILLPSKHICYNSSGHNLEFLHSY